MDWLDSGLVDPALVFLLGFYFTMRDDCAGMRGDQGLLRHSLSFFLFQVPLDFLYPYDLHAHVVCVSLPLILLLLPFSTGGRQTNRAHARVFSPFFFCFPTDGACGPQRHTPFHPDLASQSLPTHQCCPGSTSLARPTREKARTPLPFFPSRAPRQKIRSGLRSGACSWCPGARCCSCAGRASRSCPALAWRDEQIVAPCRVVGGGGGFVWLGGSGGVPQSHAAITK